MCQLLDLCQDGENIYLIMVGAFLSVLFFLFLFECGCER